MTLVYQHELPNVPGKSIKACSSNMARAATRLATACQIRPHLRDRARSGDPANHALCQTELLRCGNHANTGSGIGPSRAAAHIQAFCDRCRFDASRWAAWTQKKVSER